MLSFWSCIFVITVIIIVSIIVMAHGHRRHCRHRCHLISAILYHPLWLLLFLPSMTSDLCICRNPVLFPIPATRSLVGILCSSTKALLLGKHFLAPVSANEAGQIGGEYLLHFRTCMKMHFYCHSDMWKSRIIIAYCCLWNMQQTIWGSIPPRPQNDDCKVPYKDKRQIKTRCCNILKWQYTCYTRS